MPFPGTCINIEINTADTTQYRAHDVPQWSFSNSDRILPDANFWIKVFGPSEAVGHRAQQVQAYSGALQQILSNQATLFLDILILSELVKTLVRFEFNANYSQNYRNFKQFLRLARG